MPSSAIDEIAERHPSNQLRRPMLNYIVDECDLHKTGHGFLFFSYHINKVFDFRTLTK